MIFCHNQAALADSLDEVFNSMVFFSVGNAQYGQQQEAYQQGPPQQQGYPPQQQYTGQQGYPGQQQAYGMNYIITLTDSCL